MLRAIGILLAWTIGIVAEIAMLMVLVVGMVTVINSISEDEGAATPAASYCPSPSDAAVVQP